MQVVIEIDEKIYKHYKDLCQAANANQMAEYIQAIGNGVPLPKGHGDLIDFNSLEEVAERMNTPYGTSGYGVFVDDIREYARPIIASVEKGAEK